MTAKRNLPLVPWMVATAIAFATVPNVSADPTAVLKEEHVTGGALDLAWLNGLGISNNLQPLTLTPDHPAYNNPSGDHTVGVATNSIAPDSGGVVLSCTDPEGAADYIWEGWIFTGDGNSRRGLVVRADPGNQFGSCYQFVVQSGLFQINFRRLVNSAPTTLATWFSSQLPAGSLPLNTWHRMQVQAAGPTFRCWIDGFELTSLTGPINDATHATGWVGVYNFRFDVGGIPVYYDDLILWDLGPTAGQKSSWGTIKSHWR